MGEGSLVYDLTQKQLYTHTQLATHIIANTHSIKRTHTQCSSERGELDASFSSRSFDGLVKIWRAEGLGLSSEHWRRISCNLRIRAGYQNTDITTAAQRSMKSVNAGGCQTPTAATETTEP